MVYTVIRILVIAVCCTLAGVRAMHMLQVSRYQTPELRRELRRYGDVLLRTDVLIAAIVSVVNWYMPVLFSMFMQRAEARETLCNWLMLPLFMGATAISFFQKRRIPLKKPFTFSQRVGRLMGVVFVLNLLGAVILYLLTLSPYLMFAGADYAVLLAAIVTRPLEERINARYYRAARRKLVEHKGLIRIGITGSYGKTETKLILRAILSEKYNVLATPPSFSSAMGASRVINEQLNKKHEVFIAELGAQKKGEIREIARVIRPKYGVITCIGPAHLDSFGSLEAVAQTKYELAQSLSKSGAVFFGSDGGFGDRLYGLCPIEKYRAAVGGEVESYMRAEHVETTVKGTRFELICETGECAWVQTRLLGTYAAKNIALAAAVAHRLGLTMEEIRSGVEKIRPIRGHMQLISGPVNVIDDSLNTIPEAATDALKILSEFPGRRIVVTAGLTELEKGANEANFELGMRIAACADYAILIGPEETRHVLTGINKSGEFPSSSIRVVRDPEDAAELVKELAEEGDTVLYEGVLMEEDGEE